MDSSKLLLSFFYCSRKLLGYLTFNPSYETRRTIQNSRDTNHGHWNGEDLRRFDALQLEVDGHGPVLRDRDRVRQPLDDPDDGREDDVALDHRLKDGLDADLDELASRRGQVDESLLLPPNNLYNKKFYRWRFNILI